MATFFIKGIDPNFWQAVQARAKQENRQLRALGLRLFDLYVKHGLDAIEAGVREAPTTQPPTIDKTT